ncbi:MAG: FG-GAP repeat protein [Turneriella sp.]|nr:FG-GAP repeat protein [Turneriella sp.]
MPRITIWLVLLFFAACKSWGRFWEIDTDSVAFTPTSGPVGTLVTLSSPIGFDFSSLSEARVGGVSALVLNRTSSSALIFMMPGSVTGPITARNPTSSVSSSSSFTVTPTGVPAKQQGAKLVGTGNLGAASQGYSVALSADGNTALIGGLGDNSNIGAVWVFVRSGTTWSQQAKLVGTGFNTASNQGARVALSADGNTALVGGPIDDSYKGAVWVFVRSGSTWSQQGPKLVGTGGTTAQQGSSVALSADGNTALIGGFADNSSQGAVWVFVRSGSTWSQQGPKLVGTGGNATAQQGMSVALSADGNTALIGGNGDDGATGAAWVFVRSGSHWLQQGSKLVGTPCSTNAQQGISVALSADGNTALIGGSDEDSGQGAVWVFVRSGSTWSQQGPKLVGTPSSSMAQQGISVSLSADGNVALIGGSDDTGGQGAAWVFVRSGSAWSQHGEKLFATDNDGYAHQGYGIALSADGHTALIGGFGDNTLQGAAWVWVP